MRLGKWLGLAVAAVILAEGIWGILVSLTRSLLLPLLARVLAVDSHSPLYLGTGGINIPDLFAAILQLCLAGIVFLIIKAWAGKPDEVRLSPAKKITQAPVAATTAAAVTAPAPKIQPAPAPVPVSSQPAASMAAAPQTAPTPVAARPTPPLPAPTTPPPQTAPPPLPAAPKKSVEKPAPPPKPAKPREVYYNIVGEPINPTEDE